MPKRSGCVDSIKIGWKEYKIIEKEVIYVDGMPCYGSINHEKQEIFIRSIDTKAQQEATLLHEVLHGVSDMHGIVMDEEIVTRLADALYTVIQDNKQVRIKI